MPSSMSKQTVGLLGLIAVLAVTCLALVIVLANKPSIDELPESEMSRGEAPVPPAPPEEEKEKPILTEPWETDVRLSKNVLPLHYDLYLHPDLDKDVFTGRVRVHVDSKEPTSHFRLHTKQLEITSAKVFDASANEVELLEAFEYEPNEYFVFKTNGQVPAGKYFLALEFQGNLTGNIVGFYKSVYTNGAGERVPIATSKFQPTDARGAFPCFDEPSFKSTFTTTLVRPSEKYIALSNMPEESSKADTPAKGLTEVTFQKSVPMVTYLACFIVSDFGHAEKLTEKGVQFRVYAAPNKVDGIEYALDIGANITDFFTDYFDVPYPLPKQDMVAIPDFISGAMEHWGLITYREVYLLFGEDVSSSSNKQRVATIVSHELAHQWFGNLVTLSWWDDLWLNEGFASYIEYKGVAQYHPDWDIDGQFLTADLYPAFDLDSTVNSHPIVQRVDHPDQITEIFDAISYRKGSSILRMLESFMGEEDFRKGISNFLKRYKFDNAVTADLWRELEAISSEGLNITRIMDTWTRQMGYPVVQVERRGPTTLRLTQSRYLTDPDAQETVKREDNPFGYKWDVPITYITNKGGDEPERKWLHSNDGFLDVEVDADAEFVKFNVGQFGFYRVNYPKEDWIKFSEMLQENHETFSTMDRASLLHDAFSLAESGHVDYSIPLSMTRYLKAEKDLVPWRTVYNKLTSIEKLLKNTEVYPLFREYVLSLVSEPYDRLGWEDAGSHTERQTRILVLHLACRNGHKGCSEEVGKLFKQWIADEDMFISPNLRNMVYKYGMNAEGDADAWNVMLDRFVKEGNAQEQRKLLHGLAWANQPWILARFLNLATNETIVRSQDYFFALNYIAGNPIGTPLVWDYVRSNWDNLVSRFSLNNRYLGRLPKQVTSGFSSTFKLEEVKAFYEKYPEGGAGSRSRKQGLEKVENNIKWLERHQETIHMWLEQNAKN